MRLWIPSNVKIPMGLIAICRKYQVPIARKEAAPDGGPMWLVG